MKMKRLSITLVFAVLICFSSSAEAQNHDHPTVSTPSGESWKPVNKFNAAEQEEQKGNTVVAPAPLTNVLDGVSFYRMVSVCEGKKVFLLKLINSNDYPVKVQWQLSPSSQKVYVNIPARKDYEGNCSSTDANIKKLIIEQPQKDKAVDKDFLFKSIKVSK